MDTKKLRQKILDLAIHGKLVPQDPNDEPASVLLERIKAEKERLIKEGKIKRSKKTATTSDSRHYPFELPSGWVWTTINDICSKIGSGSTPRGSNYAKEGIPFFRSQNVYNDGLVYDDIKYISEEVHENMIGTEVRAKDLLLNITGGSLGRCAIVPDEFQKGNVSQHVCILRTIIVLPAYLHLFIISDYFAATMILSGSGREGLPKYSLETMQFPLPPIEEQKRIMAAVNKWFALIDTLETAKEDLQTSITLAKSKILDLAIHGKLVSQDPADEPASELLKRVNPSAEITCDNEQYWNMPRGWVICNFNQIFKTVSSKQFQIQQSEILTTGKTPVVSQSSLFIEGYSNETNICKYHPSIIFGDHTRNVKYIDFEFIVGADGVKILMPEFNPKYAYYLIKYATLNIENKGYSRHFGQISKFKFPLPPLAEQQRIVAKIEELFAQLDAIENSLQA